MTRVFQQRRVQVQWSDTALTSADKCPACSGHMIGIDRTGVTTLICEDCARKWQVELGQLYEVTIGAVTGDDQLQYWTELVQPEVSAVEEK